MKKLLLISLACLSLAAKSAESEIDRMLLAMAGTESRFVHHFRAKGARRELVERGSVSFGSLPLMRWEYETPEKKTFVFDGSKSHFYLPADRQVTITELTTEQRKSLPFLFLSDSKLRERSFRRSERSTGRMTTIELRPRSSEGELARVVLTVSRPDHLLRRLEYADRLGNITVFEFSTLTRKAIPDSRFQFQIPPGVQVVEN